MEGATEGLNNAVIAQVIAQSKLHRAIRTACVGLGALVVISGSWAVFLSRNEIGTAVLLLSGVFLCVIGIQGHVPTVRWGGAELDPTAYIRIGQADGANDAAKVAAEASARVGTPEEVADAVRHRAISAVGSSRDSQQSREGHFDAEEPIEASATERARAAAPGVDPQVNVILDRFAAFNGQYDHAGLAAGMTSLGFTANAPMQRGGQGPSDLAYIGWKYQGEVKSLTLFQNSAGLVVDSKRFADIARRLPAALPDVEPRQRVRLYYSAGSLDAVLESARILRAVANGEEFSP